MRLLYSKGFILTLGIPAGTVRIVNVSSVKHLFAPRGGVDYDSLEPNSVSADHIRGRLGLDKLYAQSKWVSAVVLAQWA